VICVFLFGYFQCIYLCALSFCVSYHFVLVHVFHSFTHSCFRLFIYLIVICLKYFLSAYAYFILCRFSVFSCLSVFLCMPLCLSLSAFIHVLIYTICAICLCPLYMLSCPICCYVMLCSVFSHVFFIVAIIISSSVYLYRRCFPFLYLCVSLLFCKFSLLSSLCRYVAVGY